MIRITAEECPPGPYDQGRVARVLDLPTSANPYNPDGADTHNDAWYWLQGWHDEDTAILDRKLAQSVKYFKRCFYAGLVVFIWAVAAFLYFI